MAISIVVGLNQVASGLAICDGDSQLPRQIEGSYSNGER